MGSSGIKKEYEEDNSVLKQLNIKIDLGRTLNKNKNPVAENAIKEFHKERLRLNPAGGPVTEIERARITKNMNSRIRDRGFSSKEIAFQRDQMSNRTKSISDEKMSCVQYQNRKENHPTGISKSKVRFKPGDNVFVKSDKNKLKGREMYKVVEVFNKNDEDWAKLQKSETQFRSKEYLVKCAEILHVPVPTIIEDEEVHSQENSSHDTQHNKADDTSTEVLEPQSNDYTKEDVYDTVQKEAHREPEGKTVS